MKEKHSSNFLIGFLIGLFIAAVLWYWQKSTAADEGALELLDRMAEMERQRVQLPAVAEAPDDLQQARGIGPVFDGRLRQAGIDTFVKLKGMSAEKLAAMLEIGQNRAAAILADVSRFLQ